MAYATGRHMAQGFFNYAYEADEVAAMVREVYKGRVRFHDGDAELAPGLSLHRIGGHTKGVADPRWATRSGRDVLCSCPPPPHTQTKQAPPSPLRFPPPAKGGGSPPLCPAAAAPRH